MLLSPENTACPLDSKPAIFAVGWFLQDAHSPCAASALGNPPACDITAAGMAPTARRQGQQVMARLRQRSPK